MKKSKLQKQIEKVYRPKFIEIDVKIKYHSNRKCFDVDIDRLNIHENSDEDVDTIIARIIENIIELYGRKIDVYFNVSSIYNNGHLNLYNAKILIKNTKSFEKWYYSKFGYGVVTHWMPLPEPPLPNE
jgi:hypothetical protein